ncbi:phospho-sugar mutase [Sodaliphilus sp.]|uniref:phospho-sugar mutase n=1 Tax=Sodaliphilus sp. TaxID=2815818 RepID=UPI00388DFE63
MADELLIKQVTEKAQGWLSAGYDEKTQAQVKAMIEAEDKTELIESFYKDLEFGTGGLRGIMGAGSNRMNIYTVGSATQGLANYLKEAFKDLEQIKVVVGHDVRNNSRLFAETVANIFSANGIKVYLFEGPRPTPEVSYAIRHLGCQSGVNITASHNPKEYNGYKAYWDDGAQVVSPHDVNIIDYVNRISDVSEIKFEGNPALIETIGEKIDNEYLEEIHTLSLSPEVNKRQHDLKIVYTPIHGVGRYIVPRSIERWGFDNIIHVPEQDVMSGDFPTVDSPNPENASAMALAIKKAEEVQADIVLASDPDADRIGLVIKNTKGEYALVNGNQIQIIFHYYLMARSAELGLLKGDEYIVKTIVTSETIRKIAEKQNIKMFDCYTGFKWIATVMREMEGKGRYLGGGEESYGFLPQTFVRDKDSVSSIPLMCEIAAWAKDRGMTMNDMLIDIYKTYGYSKELGISVVRPGKTGAEEIVAMMKNFRENPMKEIAGSPVVTIKDFKTLEQKNVVTGAVEKLDMSTTSNVLQYYTEDGTKVSIRPSGTEPKIKFYIEVHDTLDSAENYDAKNEWAQAKLDQIAKDLGIA